MSLRFRLLLYFAAIVLIAMVGVVLIARQGATSEVQALMARGGLARLEGLVDALEDHYQETTSWEGAETIITSYSPTQGYGQANRPDHAGPGMKGAANGQNLVLADADGLVLSSTVDSPSNLVLDREEINKAIPLKSGFKTVGYLLPTGGITFSFGDERLLVSRLNRAALIAGIIAGSLALLLAFYLANHLVRPVRALTTAAHHLAAGDLTHRVPILGYDELAGLGHSFNQMADSLQHAQESRRAMTADIAHELRTPLAVQRANLEAIKDGVYEINADNLDSILDQNLHLTRLVDDLGILALADSGQMHLDPIPIDIIELVRRTADRFLPQAEAGRVNILQPHPVDTLTALVDPTRFEQVVVNLLSNALRYVPPGGWIKLLVEPDGSCFLLTVQDNGPGIPPEALPYIFERFFRPDRSRTRKDGGSGLGLAITRQLVQAHGGTIDASNHPEGGAVFKIKLPTGTEEA